MKRIVLMAVAAASCAAAAQAPAAADAVRARMQLEQVVAEAQRLGENFDLLSENQGRLDGRMAKLEGELASIRELKAEIAALRAENASLKARQEALRREIVDDIAKKLGQLGVAPAARASAPAPAASAAPAPAAPVSRGPGYEHIVEPGQTLSEIARGYGVSVAKIKAANALKSDNLRIGQKLFVPDPPKK